MSDSGVHRALERVRFGPRRTLNVRDGLLSAPEAARRVDGWLRSRQLELTGDVLVITGRGAGSEGGIAAVREATVKTLHALRRAGVVESFAADTPGSFVVTLAPLRSLLEAPTRRRVDSPPARRRLPSIEGLGEGATARLRELALRSLESLGMTDPSPNAVSDEMGRQFSRLVRGAPPATGTDRWLEEAIERAILEYEDRW